MQKLLAIAIVAAVQISGAFGQSLCSNCMLGSPIAKPDSDPWHDSGDPANPLPIGAYNPTPRPVAVVLSFFGNSGVSVMHQMEDGRRLFIRGPGKRLAAEIHETVARTEDFLVTAVKRLEDEKRIGTSVDLYIGNSWSFNWFLPADPNKQASAVICFYPIEGVHLKFGMRDGLTLDLVYVH